MRNKIILLRIFNILLPYVGHKKTIDVRLGYPKIRAIKPGNVIRYNKISKYDQIVFEVRWYKSVDELLAVENWQQIDPTATSKENLLAKLNAVFPDWLVEKLGICAIDYSVAH